MVFMSLRFFQSKYFISKSLTNSQISSFNFVIHTLRPFPLDQYTKLNESFKNLFPSIYGVAAGAQSLRIALLSLVSEQEDVRAYLHMFRFMTDRLFEIARKAVLALRSATEALHR